MSARHEFVARNCGQAQYPLGKDARNAAFLKRRSRTGGRPEGLIAGHPRDLAPRGGGTSGFAPFCPADHRTAAVIAGQARRISPQMTRDHRSGPTRGGTGWKGSMRYPVELSPLMYCWYSRTPFVWLVTVRQLTGPRAAQARED